MPCSQNILSGGIDKLLNQEPSVNSARSIILSALNFEYLGIVKNLGVIDDATITSDQFQRVMPELTPELEQKLSATFLPKN